MNVTWEEIRLQISSELPKNCFSLWIDPIAFQEDTDHSVTLFCPNKFSRNWVYENYFDLIDHKLRKAGATNVDLIYKSSPPKRKPYHCQSLSAPHQLTLPNLKTNPRHGHMTLNDGYTFDRFVVGHSNEFAYSASKALANGDSWNYHSLLMLASTGLGKSHLSHAAGHAILQKNPKTRVLYLTAEDFTNEMVFSLKNNRIDEFKNKYRRLCDVLLLEEIHFLTGKEKTQTELGYTLDSLCNENKKIMFTSSLAPKDIPHMSKGLSSRLSSGLVATIDQPDHDTRVKILRQKASEENIKLSQDIIDFLATRLTKDIRQMESAIKYLNAKSIFLNASIDLDLARDVIGCLVSGQTNVSAANIKKLVTKYYKIDPDMLRSKSRKKVYAHPRNIYLYLCRRHTDETLENLAQTINRSHSTVLYSLEVVEHKMKTDNNIRNQIHFLNQKIEEMKT